MIELAKIETNAPDHLHKEEIKEETNRLLEKMQERQKVLFAQAKYSLLVILQGMDASGKDGVMNKVFSNLNLLGCRVVAFKAPTEEEKSQDFLWRIHKHAPPKGIITIFNRSHYEDVLVPYVEKWIDKEEVKKRYTHINNFESLLADHHTHVLKFYLHVSEDEQRERLQERLTNPEKYWKHSDGDWRDIEKRKEYVKAYEKIFSHCSEVFPWHIIPADHNWYKAYLIAKHVTETLQELDLKYPKLVSQKFKPLGE
jgi:PPK2 family polyphosphate:nucleotide phosphotransferase